MELGGIFRDFFKNWVKTPENVIFTKNNTPGHLVLSGQTYREKSVF